MKTRKHTNGVLTDFPLRKQVIAMMGAGLVLIFLTSFIAGGRMPAEGSGKARGAAQSDVMAAVPDLMAKLKNSPEDEPTILELAEIFSRVQDWPKAVQFWSKAATIDSQNIGTRFHRATALVHLERYDEAIKDYEFILQVKPQAYQALYYLGMINKYGLQKPAAAKTYFQRALDLKPEHPQMVADLEKELADLK